MDPRPFIIEVAVRPEALEADDYVSRLPAVRALVKEPLKITSPVTFLVGENGSGKSTLLEATAIAMGFNPEGGSRNFSFSTRDTHSGLSQYVRASKSARYPKDGFFLRAESFYNVATQVDELDYDGRLTASYGGKSLHHQSHGESFLALILNRFGGDGLYLLDEPEAALSPTRQMSMLSLMHDMVRAGSQFIIATHSPILMAYPGADIFQLDEKGICRVEYRETEHYRITRRFLESPERMLRYLFEEDSE